jgi:hypothetical protein
MDHRSSASSEKTLRVKSCLGLETYVWHEGALARPEDLHELEVQKHDSLYHVIVRMIRGAMETAERLVPSR